ncbi:MAG: flavodoxin family protein [Dethiobacteria bacterium]
MPGILAISSSPRRGGNSELALRSFCRAAEEKEIPVEMIRLHELNLQPCHACDRCAKSGICAIQDQMQTLYKKVIAATALVLATPIYFGSLSAQLKVFIDRFQCWWQAKYRLKTPFVSPEEGKAGFIICTGALQKPEYGDNIAAIGKVFFHNLNYKSGGILCLQGFDQKGAINDDPVALIAAYNAGVEFIDSFIL